MLQKGERIKEIRTSENGAKMLMANCWWADLVLIKTDNKTYIFSVQTKNRWSICEVEKYEENEFPFSLRIYGYADVSFIEMSDIERPHMDFSYGDIHLWMFPDDNYTEILVKDCCYIDFWSKSFDELPKMHSSQIIDWDEADCNYCIDFIDERTEFTIIDSLNIRGRGISCFVRSLNYKGICIGDMFMDLLQNRFRLLGIGMIRYKNIDDVDLRFQNFLLEPVDNEKVPQGCIFKIDEI